MELLRKWFWSNLELKSEGSQRLKRAFFQFFGNIWVTKLKPFPGKLRQGVQSCLNQNLVVRSFSGTGFEPTLSSKTNVLRVWKEHFSVFCKFLCDEVETFFWKSEAKRLKMFKSIFGHRKLLRKWLWSYLDLKNECSYRLKRAFSRFLQIFKWRSWNHFLEKISKALKTVYI